VRRLHTEVVVNEIEVLYLRYPIHPNVSAIHRGAGIERIVRGETSYWVIGAADGPLVGRRVEIPADNVAGIQWKMSDEATRSEARPGVRPCSPSNASSTSQPS
jgi:hypothetical protein